jgi:hypothetical protein
MLNLPTNPQGEKQAEMDSLRQKMVRDLEEFLSETMDQPMPRLFAKFPGSVRYDEWSKRAARVQPC